jgi:hypothetical protein
MPRTAGVAVPKYSKHKASGQAVVTIGGVGHYLGPHETKASLIEYDRLIAKWMANDGLQMRITTGDQQTCGFGHDARLGVLHLHRQHQLAIYDVCGCVGQTGLFRRSDDTPLVWSGKIAIHLRGRILIALNRCVRCRVAVEGQSRGHSETGCEFDDRVARADGEVSQ